MKSTSKLALIFTVVSALLVSSGSRIYSQTELDLPLASQAAEVEQTVGVTRITINYHRPLVGGRKIWGGLVPLGQPWRAGANENTTIEFSTPVSVEGKPLPAGKYGLHMIPNPDKWTIIFSKMAEAWGSYTYNQSEDALRVEVKPRENEMEEALEYEFEDLKPDSTTVTMKWEKIAVPFTVTVKDEDSVFPSVRNQLRGKYQYTWTPPYEAAQYCLTKKKNYEEGLKWVDLSIQNEERFENLYTKAELLKALNRSDESKKFRDRALEIGTPVQMYSQARTLQFEKRGDEATPIFQALVKKSPDSVFGHLAQARLKVAAGDFDGALAEAKAADAVAPQSDQIKASIKRLIERLQKKEDINK
ncbi:MAG TPA: DUF2911 domain-containing protein [Chthoniobacterales bacterium]|nr:DUF2911 domain-containing protein [Chthoniobacterales bacterium]